MNTFAIASKTSAFGSRIVGRRAFTIIELIVAMGIATVMLFLINRIFFDTTNAVSRGIGLSHIIGESRAISSTLETDFIANEIVKPGAGGFMFIGFKEYQNVDFPNPRRQVGTAIQQSVSSDQMLLTLNISGQSRTPLTPRDDGTFSPYTPFASTQNALLWYGHVARLFPNGDDAGELDNPTRNRFGHQWIVGRQLMFLDPDVDTILGPTPPPPAYVDGLYARSFVLNYTITPTPPLVAPHTRWMGLNDVIHANLDDFTGPTPAILTDAAAISNISYMAQVARVAYTTERLRVAATVEPNSATPASSYSSWNLAQTHPAFMSFCSDFQISFAGDFDSDGRFDVEDTIPGPPVTPPAIYQDLYTGGNIKWYGYPTNIPAYIGTNPAPSYDPTKPAVYNPVSASTPVINGANPGDPYFTDDVTIIPEINTQINPAVIANLQVERAIVFRHDAATPLTQWPHLIRIRYRLHDERGEIESTNGLTRAQGIWFEQIVRIQ